MSDKKDLLTIGIVGPVRFSYMSVFAPKENTIRQCMEYSVVCLVPKQPNTFCPDPKAVIKSVVALVENAIEKKFGQKPAKWDNPIRDGDEEVNDEGEPKYPGYWFFNTRADTDHAPVTIDPYREPVKSGWQSGDWGNIKLNTYGYEFKGKRGVGIGVRAVQFVSHDTPFGDVQDPDQVAMEFPEVAVKGDDYDPFAE